MNSYVKHEEQVVRAPHYNLYAQWKRDEICMGDTNVGYGLTDTFINAGGAVDTNVGGWAGYKTYEDTGCTILPSASGEGIVFQTDTTDNDEAWLQAGYSVGGPFVIADSSPKELIFCAEFKVDSISGSAGVFIGLGEPGLAAADTIDNSGALADKDLIGFFRPEGDGDGLDFVFRKSGGSVVEHITDAVTLVADTYVTVGFKFDGKRVVQFYNGSLQTENAISNTLVGGATFPDGEAMHMVAGIKNGAAAARSMELRFWECQQYS